MKPREAVLSFLKLIIKDRRNLIRTLLAYTKEADKRLYYEKKYKDQKIPFVDIGEIAKIDEKIDNYTYLKGTSRPIDIAFLMAVCKKYDNCNYLEIGSWRGESLVNVAKVAKKCTSISLSKQEILSMGMSKKVADLQRMFSRDISNINHIEANSINYDFNQLNEKFDVIFIDGDHSYRGVKSDTENAFKLLRDKRSVIIWHDCGDGYEGFNYEVISAILDGTPHDKRSKIYRVSNSLCGIYTNQNVTPEFLESPQVPNKTFSIDLTLKYL